VLRITIAAPLPRLLAALLPIVVLVTSFACSDGGDDPPPTGGPTRSVMLGFSSLPRELNTESYADAIDFAGDHGEIVLIQRAVPWEEFVPGATLGDDFAEQTNSERDAVRDEDLTLFFAMDPTDGATGRDRLAALPESMAGRRFDDEDVRTAFRSYAEYVALNYKVEMNLYYEKNKDDWDNFLSLYRETYAAVKATSPDTQITVTLQYEDLQGILPREDAHFVDWQLRDQRVAGAPGGIPRTRDRRCRGSIDAVRDLVRDLGSGVRGRHRVRRLRAHRPAGERRSGEAGVARVG
jgi:hypothetical protein